MRPPQYQWGEDASHSNEESHDSLSGDSVDGASVAVKFPHLISYALCPGTPAIFAGRENQCRNAWFENHGIVVEVIRARHLIHNLPDPLHFSGNCKAVVVCILDSAVKITVGRSDEAPYQPTYQPPSSNSAHTGSTPSSYSALTGSTRKRQ